MNHIEAYKNRRAKRLAMRMDGFDETAHPRDENGRFKSGGVSKGSVESALGSAKTGKAIGAALKKAGISAKNTSSEYGYPNFKIDTGDGGYIRVYVKGSGKSAETKVQEWKPDRGEAVKSDDEIKGVKQRVKSFAEKMTKQKDFDFKKLNDSEKWEYVAAKTAKYFIDSGIDHKKAWTRAIDQADSWKKKGFEGYGYDADNVGKTVLGSIIEGLKRRQ